MIGSHLHVHDLQEEDISDASPSLTLHSTGTSTSTLAVSPPDVGYSSVHANSRPGLILESDIAPNLSRRRDSVLLNSPSSPNLLKSALPRMLSRSRTLPRMFQLEGQPRKLSEVESLPVDPNIVRQMRRWIMGIAIIDFDIDHGPIISGIYPPLTLLSTEEENIAFSSLPDSFQFDQGSQSHSFRIRQQDGLPNENRPPCLDGYIYGYSHFTQRKDPSSKRGYQQRSLVILSQYQYPAFFTVLSSMFGPLFHAHGIPMLEAACHSIATWRDPTPGATLELGFLGTVLHLEIPHTADEQQLTETSSFNQQYDPKTHIIASSPPLLPAPLLLFEASLSHLWSVWECLVLCEPILVFGASPAQTSQAIWWFRDLLRPIPLAGDMRPYFTMQDGDHSALVNKLPPKAGLLLGVTNPFFAKSCAHWPHTISLGRRVPPHSGTKSKSSPAAGPMPGWKTKTHKRFISKDRVLLKLLEAACDGNEQARLDASLALRRHFCSRTTAVITPVARYLHTLIPTPPEVARARSLNEVLRLKPFNTANFFVSLKAHGSPLPFRSTHKRTEFYQRWLKTPAFGIWLAQQESVVQGVLAT